MAVFWRVTGNQHPVRIQRNIEGVGEQAQHSHGLLKGGVIHVQPHLRGVNAVVNGSIHSIGLEDLFDRLLSVCVQMEAVQSTRMREGHGFRHCSCRLLVERNRLLLQDVIAQLVKMLGDLDIVRVEFESVSQGCALAGRIAAQPISGRSLDKRRDGMAAGQCSCKGVVGVGGVKPGGLLVVLQGVFKLLFFEEPGRIKVQLHGPTPVAAVW